MERQEIRGDSRPVALLGYPVAHSLSPLIHNHAFARLGLPFVYVPLPVAPSSLHTALTALRACGFAGANVTIPHKAAVVPYCDHLSALSALTGTVNTLYFEDGRLCGTTTDPAGFYRSLERNGATLEGAHVVIVGNGGTARTLAYAIASRRDAASLSLVGRNPERVGALAAEVQRRTAHPLGWGRVDAEEGAKLLARCTLLVNCTSAGMHPATDVTPVPAALLHGGMTVVDAIYNPARTLLMRQAEALGCVTANGLGMLLYQGLASFRYWTGVEAHEELFDLDELRALIDNH